MPADHPLPPPPAVDAPKERWRAWARDARRRVATPERSRRVAEGLRAWPAYRHVQTVLLYLAFGSEVDLELLLADDARQLLVPRSEDAPTPGLSLHRLHGAPLEKHPFGPLQPPAGTPAVGPEAVELALVPGLCFDVTGTRLGYGRGYFDRFLAGLPADVPRVGVTFDALVVERLPREPHDVGVTHLATESGVVAVTTPPPAARAPTSS
ncbi:MAG: 5-formyltetrahydrofolate cyclo-ligase [Deinococcales bacterium]